MNKEEAEGMIRALKAALGREPEKRSATTKRAANYDPVDDDPDEPVDNRNRYSFRQDNPYLRMPSAGGALRRSPVEFALTVLGNVYGSCLANGDETRASFIRTDVQRFMRGGRRHYCGQDSPLLRQFIDECLESKEVMSEEDYNDYVELYRGHGTVDALIKDAGDYKKQRAGQLDLDSFAYEFKW